MCRATYGEFAASDKARFYRFARRSATECAAILDICQGLKLVNEAQASAGREKLISVVAMLTTMVVRISRREKEREGAGAGAGAGIGEEPIE
jgi:four helix bundle protein